MLNPLAFESFEAFQEARKKEGLKKGWTFIPNSGFTITNSIKEIFSNIQKK